MKEFKINLWTTLKIVSIFMVLLSLLIEEITEIQALFNALLFVVATGFKSIDDKLENETNLIEFKWSIKNV